MESQSEHPLAEAVVKELREEGVKPAIISRFNSITGRGVEAMDADDTMFYIGNQKLLAEHNVNVSDELDKRAKALRDEAKTVIFFANQVQALAVLAIADKIKDTSKKAIETLLERNVDVYMLTGDNQQTAQTVADQVGLKHFKAEALPSDKADFVKELQAKGKIVAMVGDGINDSHALAQADVSIAMGHGSDIAMDVAKITLITSDLQSIPKALNLSKKSVLAIRQNLFWAFIYNIIGIPIAAGLLYSINGFLLDPMIAGMAMAFSSVSVVANSLRLKAAKI
jgi:Cu2+-exporting ATPase